MPCPACRFDASRWTDSDLSRTLDVVMPMGEQLAEGAPADVARALRPLLERLAALPRGAADPDAVHEAWHVLSDAGRLRHELGAGAPTSRGVVAQVSTSSGGVPKLPVGRTAVAAGGLAGDRQDNRVHHGRPWQALCLWAAEVVDGLAAAGHPIGYGSAGENLTLRGLPWPAVRPGVRLRVGTALLETTAYAVPCRKNARWFSDGDFRRMAHEVAPGGARVYAKVLIDGHVAAGDEAVLEPEGLSGPQR